MINLDESSPPSPPRLSVGQHTLGDTVVSHVNISGVRSEDGGTYACTARNAAGVAAHAARLNVYGGRKDEGQVYSPLFNYVNSVFGYPVGSDIDTICMYFSSLRNLGAHRISIL